MNPIRTWLQRAALLATASLALATAAQAQHAGLRNFALADGSPVALFYPTTVADRVVPMGPWRPVVAPGAPASAAPLKGLILVSHGTGGTELNHHDLGTRLAREGYLVVAVRHAGDNWQDRSLVASGRYFGERPRQLSRVLDALLASPEWGPRIPAGRIGAVGHSAGGYSVLALAGAEAEPARVARHCRDAADDKTFCGLAEPAPASPAAAFGPASAADPATLDGERVSVPDRRITAVVAMAPMAVVLTPASLAGVRVPVRVLMAGKDAVLTAAHHGGHVAAHLPAARVGTVAGAGHFAFMARSAIPLPSAAGDAAADPPGFDRAAYLPELADEVVGFFAGVWP